MLSILFRLFWGGPQNTIVLVIGTPETGTPNLGKPSYISSSYFHTSQKQRGSAQTRLRDVQGLGLTGAPEMMKSLMEEPSEVRAGGTPSLNHQTASKALISCWLGSGPQRPQPEEQLASRAVTALMQR